MELKMFERRPIVLINSPQVYREMSKEYQRSRKKEKAIKLDCFLKTTGLTSRNYAARLLRLHGKSVRVICQSRHCQTRQNIWQKEEIW